MNLKTNVYAKSVSAEKTSVQSASKSNESTKLPADTFTKGVNQLNSWPLSA
jgi:hypothetical protein